MTAFPEGTRLVLSHGDRMGATEEVLVGAVAPNEDFTLTLPLVTPKEVGRYTGFWQLQAPGEGEGAGSTIRFGPHLVVDVVVDTVAEWQMVEGEQEGEPAATGNQHEEKEQWRDQLEALKELGLVDVEANLDMVDKYYEEGGLEMVVDRLQGMW